MTNRQEKGDGLVKLNFFAPLNFHLGYGIHGTNLAKAIDKLGHDITYIPTEPIQQKLNDFDLIKLLRKKIVMDVPAVNLSVGSLMYQFYGKPRIGYSVLEVDRIPDTWVEMFNQLDYVWATTHWGKKVFEDSGVKKDVKVVPEGVDTFVFSPYALPVDEIKSSDSYKFLCIGKYEVRKGYDILLNAFCEEFNKDEKVEIYIMPYNPFVREFNIWAELFALDLPSHKSKIKVINPILNHSDVARIYVSCDAYVMPSKGEGWGLPYIEAMACGLPTIGTNWSGNTEFMNENNSLLIPIDGLEQANDPIFGEFLKQGKWAIPNKEKLKEYMRWCFENREEAKALGEKARKDVEEKWTWQEAAKKAIKEIEDIVNNTKLT